MIQRADIRDFNQNSKQQLQIHSPPAHTRDGKVGPESEAFLISTPEARKQHKSDSDFLIPRGGDRCNRDQSVAADSIEGLQGAYQDL